MRHTDGVSHIPAALSQPAAAVHGQAAADRLLSCTGLAHTTSCVAESKAARWSGWPHCCWCRSLATTAGTPAGSCVKALIRWIRVAPPLYRESAGMGNTEGHRLFPSRPPLSLSPASPPFPRLATVRPSLCGGSVGSTSAPAPGKLRPAP
jgi:hypothetical protein